MTTLEILCETMLPGAKVTDRIAPRLPATLISTAEELSRQIFDRTPAALTAAELQQWMEALRHHHLALFRQLRLELCAAYLADPAGWQLTSFPGPSIDTGGYPDFADPQS